MIKENQLLNRIIKAVTGKESAPEVEAKAAEATETLTVVLDTTAVETELSQMRTELDGVVAGLSAELATAVAALTDMTANFEAAQAALNALTAEKAEMVVKAEAAKFTARKEKVVLAIGTEKADGLMLATQGLDDVAFEAVVSALAGSVDAEAETSLFKEVGVQASADTTKIVAESSEMKLIKQKYNGAK
jgi:hypothetical protein